MEIIIAITFCFVFAASILAGILVAKCIALSSENVRIKNYTKKAIAKINQARYGNFQIQLSDKKDPLQLYKSLNSLFESIKDRDLVISEYREKEKENYALKEEFIATLTHDLKVPIIAQDKTFDLFLQDKFGPLTNIQQEVFLKLKKSNSDLKDIVTSILETYKAENQGVILEIVENINVSDFLEDTISDLSDIAKSLDKKIYYHPAKAPIFADFDPLQIKMVLNNLITNAIRHSGDVGKVDVYLTKTDDRFSVDVADYGDGIDEAEIKKIFNKYYSIRSGWGVRNGLGLYLSNKIIKKHNGDLEVESKKNEGSVFRIILPLKP